MSETNTQTSEETNAASDEALQVLLIEDNPGDARLIQEMLHETEELAKRVRPGEVSGRTPDISCETRLEEALETLADEHIDIVLLDLNLPDSEGLSTLETVHEASETPIVVLTGVSDQQIGVKAIQRGAQDFLVKDEVTSELLIRTIHHAIERARQQRDRRQQREQLEALNRLNRIGHDITHAVITTETRAELEQQVCDRLAESDAYRFAWIGEVNPGSDRVSPTAAAGVEDGYLDEIEVTVDENKKSGQGPAGTAIRTEQVQVMNDARTDPKFEPWRNQAHARGYLSTAAVPIVYEDLVYGVLCIYSSSSRAFREPETAVLVRIGDVIAHAITAIERRDALVSDAVIELEFRVEALVEPLVELSVSEDCTITLEQLVSGDEALLAYGSARDVSQETFINAVERTDGISDIRILTRRRDEFEFELVAPTAVSLFETIATHGGRVAEATIDDGEFRFIVELPRGRDTRQMIELIKDRRDDVTYLAQRTVERSQRGDTHSVSVLEDELTEKQRAALETAYFGGYFDWPRESTGEEIADRLGIAPATFNQHLRTAERKFFESVFGE
ncbi:bacterio-opsin activator domain-containing protein [Natrinema hispanicum]|uniref:Predicted DNA binding protein, contains HTH domain n=1 Tax=Natrinema hispanicum TaxID=392421 RepID=A0A1G6PIE2_9EURY|nr:bacterio-opsin activator domain-containing protein [Natrinema hispanicum]SDC79187.1 Predicted DNA binding protein, contains HTH domain [Natrinema hispanicum]SET62067.1 Predicted DNA binding protein, contains HTH domain [Natrinema hispanicum]